MSLSKVTFKEDVDENSILSRNSLFKDKPVKNSDDVSDSNSDQKSQMLVFNRYGKSRIIPRSIGWLPYGIVRFFNNISNNRILSIADDDTALLGLIGTDEVIIRLSRVVINIRASKFANEQQVIPGLEELENYVGRLHEFSEARATK